MRNGHHHNQQKRMRGRNRNNRGGGGGHNPLTRVYESNGPDVKIRGTAHHIAEKYIQLARDSQSSGDPVSSEGYLQHAEHYFRLIAAAQAQYAQQNPNQPQQVYQRPDMDGDLEDGEGEEGAGDPNAQPYPGGQPVQSVQNRPQQNQQGQPQPSYNPQQNAGGLPAFITGGGQQPANGFDGNDQQGGGNRNDRNNRYGRNRNRNFRQGGNNEHRNNNNYQGDQQPQQSAAPVVEQPQQSQPEAAPATENTPNE